MEAAAQLLGFRDALRKRPEKMAQDIERVVRAVGARGDVKRRAGELRAASQAADKVVGKPGPHVGHSALHCEEIKIEYKRWRNDARVKDRRQSEFAERLHVSVSTLQRRLSACEMHLDFARSKKVSR